MRAFEVKEGTTVTVVKQGQDWVGNNMKTHTTKKDNLFFLEDIVVDPIGKNGCGPQDRKTVGGMWAQGGYYGFTKDGWVMLVGMNKVIVH